MIQQWQLQDAKNRFSEVVDNAMQQGPQMVTKRGKEAVVVISIEEYRKMQQPKNTLVDFFQSSPLKGVDLDLTRDQSGARDIDL
ncbi:MAG: antitoxin Phd [Phenylobacterium sp.]|jgi:antitoxin Phd